MGRRLSSRHFVTKFYFVRHNSILSDIILFCPTKFYFVRQNSILSDKILFCPTKFYFVRQNSILSDKILFCPTKFYFVRQNSILSDKILFCPTKFYFVQQNSILSNKIELQVKKTIAYMYLNHGHFNSVDKKYLSLDCFDFVDRIGFITRNSILLTKLNSVHRIKFCPRN